MVSIRIWALAAGVAGLVTLGIYVAVIVGEGDNTISEVTPWAAAMLVASVLALVGARANNRTVARFALLAATVLFGSLGVLAIFSVGSLLLGAAAMSSVEYAESKGKNLRLSGRDPCTHIRLGENGLVGVARTGRAA